MNQFNLYNVPVGESARIDQLTATGTIRRRLLDIGLTEGTRATCLYQSPCGDPKAYLIRGAVIALRSEDAAQIGVAPLYAAEPAVENSRSAAGNLMNLDF